MVSGNVGMLDTAAALERIHDNISHFGRDPIKLTIMGQSGGTLILQLMEKP